MILVTTFTIPTLLIFGIDHFDELINFTIKDKNGRIGLTPDYDHIGVSTNYGNHINSLDIYINKSGIFLYEKAKKLNVCIAMQQPYTFRYSLLYANKVSRYSFFLVFLN
ncbi:hypothetical protein LCGC14_0610840 [marine sediment metagenome]|uniref:Uncharacterized protein n=1 Tax=marine sediment metagenome TaxID=412755 RepID=A0A0F9RCF7_9ZZZZ